MYLRLTPNLLHFLPDLDAIYALRRAPNFYEIHPLEGGWWFKYKPNLCDVIDKFSLNICSFF
jgi:hypothetical protein